jgi:hypothetical protein
MKTLRYSISIALASALVLSGPVSPAHAAISVGATTPYTATIEGTSIWSGNLPTQIRFSGEYSAELEIPITAIMPYSQLSDRATGVEVEFELWSDAGRKIADRTIYSFSWNPVSANNIVSLRISKEDVVPNATLIARTLWTIRTTGLLSRYLEAETKVPVSILTGNPPGKVKVKSNWSGKNMVYTWGSPRSSRPIENYEVSIRYLSESGLSPKFFNNYTEPQELARVNGRKFTLSPKSLRSAMELHGAGSPSYFMVTVRAVSEMGYGEHSNGWYNKVSSFK